MEKYELFSSIVDLTNELVTCQNIQRAIQSDIKALRVHMQDLEDNQKINDARIEALQVQIQQLTDTLKNFEGNDNSWIIRH